MVSPECFISELRNSDTYITDIFTKGSCYKLYKILKLLYPQAKPYKCGNHNHTLATDSFIHAVTEIDGKYYDINGVFDLGGNTHFTLVEPMTIEDEKMFDDYSFSKMWWMPNCEECPHYE